jgi:hypothetical protein
MSRRIDIKQLQHELASLKRQFKDAIGSDVELWPLLSRLNEQSADLIRLANDISRIIDACDRGDQATRRLICCLHEIALKDNGIKPTSN